MRKYLYMISLTFIGWHGNAAVKVLETHIGSAVKTMNFSIKDLVVMNQNIVKLRVLIKKSQFKSFNVKIVDEESSNPNYILYLGKIYKHDITPVSNTSILEIPLVLVDNKLSYVHLIKTGKIKKTAFPRLYNTICMSPSINDSDDDSLDKTENIDKIIKRRVPKLKPMPQIEDFDLSYDDNVSPPKHSNPSKSSKSSIDLESEESKKKVQFAEDADVDDFFDSSESESKELPTEYEKPEKPEKSTKTKTRKQQRQELIDDAEESRWEPL